MAHRRKSSHPLCKQQRINSVVDRVLAAKLQQSEANNEFTQSVQCLDGSDENIAIPKDLFHDFQALKSATHLDTAQLMRTLIKDYAQLATPKITTNTVQPTRSESAFSNHSNHSSHSDRDTDRLSEYYRQNDSSEQKEEKSSVPTPELVDLRTRDQISEPLDLTVVKEEPSDSDEINLCVPPNQILDSNFRYPLKTQYLYNMGYSVQQPPQVQTSMRIPTVVHDVITTSNVEDKQNIQATFVNAPSVSGNQVQSDEIDRDLNSSQSIENDEENKNYKEIQFQNGALQIKGTKSNPKIQVQDINTVNNGEAMIGQNFMGALQNIGGGVLVPYGNMMTPINNMIKLEGTVPSEEDAEKNISEMSAENQVVPPTFHENMAAQYHPQNLFQPDVETDNSSTEMTRETWNQMHGKRARAMPVSEKEGKNEGKNKKGQMKLIAENTSNRGVYTSVLKLPWSRRTRNPKPDTNQLTQTPVTTTQVQSPMVLLPVAATGIPTSQGGVFIPTTSWPVQSDSEAAVTTSAQPMMMVYPNASFENFGKPVRKRGRPPKVPMIARLLADSAKKKKVENVPLTSFIPNIPTLQQPAIVLNVNNVVNTENTANALNNITTNILTEPKDNPNETTSNEETPSTGNIVQLVEAQQQQFQNIAPMPSKNINHPPLLLPKDANFANPQNLTAKPAPNVTLADGIQNIHQEILPEPKVQSNEERVNHPKEFKTMTTTTVANTASGALYQEMILSSKSLVSVKSRRRQTTTELLKSKSHSENFICTSFRLKPAKSSREKKNIAFVPGMRRRGRPPKRRLISSMFENTEIQINNGEVISTNTNFQTTQGQQVHFMPSLIQNQEMSQGVMLNQSQQQVMQDEDCKIVDQNGSNADSKCCIQNQGEEVFEAVNNGGNLENNGRRVEKSAVATALSVRSLSLDSSDNLSLSDMSEGEENPLVTMSDKIATGQEDGAMFQQLFHCRVCNEIIPVEKKEEHSSKHRKIKYSCNNCGANYNTFINQENIENLHCDSCDKTVSDSTTRHKTFVAISTKSLICTECGESFCGFDNLNSHTASVHQLPDMSVLQNILKCPMCGANFHTKKLLKHHMQFHKERIFQCPIEECGKSCITKERMKLHMKIKHAEINYVRCFYDGCKKKFLNNAHFQEHIRYKHMNIKAYKCSWPGCDTEFTTERHLKVHLLMHTDEKPLKCDYCDYRCRQGPALNWHVRKHHPESWVNYANMSGSGSSENSVQDEDIDDVVDGC